MGQTKNSVSRYVDQYSRAKKSLSGEDHPWVAKLREEGIAQFEKLGFPSVKLEEWRFTDVRPIAETPFSVGNLTITTFSDEKKVGIAVLGEFFGRDGESLKDSFGKIADPSRNPFVALNSALWDDGIYVRIPSGTVASSPVHLIFRQKEDVPSPVVTHPRIFILIERGAQAKIVEDFEGGEGIYLNNAVTEVVLEEDASLDYYRLQRESKDAFHVSTVEVLQAARSRFRSHTITVSGKIVRNDLNTTLGDQGAEVTLNGLYLVGDHQHVDNHTTIDHVKPHCYSRELYKGILDGQSRAVFNGKIIVRPDAQKTDAMQTNKNLLLSDKGRVDTKPELEIFANDVKCKHGAAVGQMNPDMLFYLRARGISEEKARHMLIYGFVSELIHGIEIAPIRNQLTEMLFGRLGLSARGFAHV